MDNAMSRSDNKLINLDFFSGDSGVKLSDYDEQTEKKKRGRPKTKTLQDGTTYVSNDNKDLPLHQSNEPYLETYNETTGLLRGAVSQIDVLQAETSKDLQDIRGSKTLRKKYDYISLLTGSMSTLISTKVTAVREINKVITDSHNLEMKRIKDLKMGSDDQDDDKKLMDMYNAFVSTPVGIQASPLGPSITDITMYGNPGVVRNEMMQDPNVGFQSYAQNLTANQNMMRLEGNPNIKTVVVLDQSTGNLFFDVVDKVTGQSIPNTEKPDPMFLLEEQGLKLDLQNGIARNNNLDRTYDLIIVGNNIMREY